MFKKNIARPAVVVEMRRLPNGYRVIPNEMQSIFLVRKMNRPFNQKQGGPINSQTNNGNNAGKTVHLTVPQFSSWFSLDQIHPIQMEAFPQYFQGSNDTFSFGVKNGRLYKYYRNEMIQQWRKNCRKPLTAGICRRILPGDASTIMHIHSFLQNWGLINFPCKQSLKLYKQIHLQCTVCESIKQHTYLAADLDGFTFILCSFCFQDECFPADIPKDSFKKISFNQQKSFKRMNYTQLSRMLQVLVKQKVNQKQHQKQAWIAVQKQFPQFTNEQLLKNFLQAPNNGSSASSIFQGVENIYSSKEGDKIDDPSVFQDCEGQLVSAVAMACFALEKKKHEGVKKIFAAVEKHAAELASIQQLKIQQMMKMLVETTFSKLQLKSLYIYEYQRLVDSAYAFHNKVIANHLAQSLRLNYVAQSQPQFIQVVLPEENRQINYFDQLNFLDLDNE